MWASYARLPQEGVEQLHHGREEVAPQAQLLYGVDLNFFGQCPVLKQIMGKSPKF